MPHEGSLVHCDVTSSSGGGVDMSQLRRLRGVSHAPPPGRPVESRPLGDAVLYGARKVLSFHLLIVDYGDDTSAGHGASKWHGRPGRDKITENREIYYVVIISLPTEDAREGILFSNPPSIWDYAHASVHQRLFYSTVTFEWVHRF